MSLSFVDFAASGPYMRALSSHLSRMCTGA